MQYRFTAATLALLQGALVAGAPIELGPGPVVVNPSASVGVSERGIGGGVDINAGEPILPRAVLEGPVVEPGKPGPNVVKGPVVAPGVPQVDVNKRAVLEGPVVEPGKPGPNVVKGPVVAPGVPQVDVNKRAVVSPPVVSFVPGVGNVVVSGPVVEPGVPQQTPEPITARQEVSASVPLPSVTVEPRAVVSAPVVSFVPGVGNVVISGPVVEPGVPQETPKPITARQEVSASVPLPSVSVEPRAEITADPTVILNDKRQEVSASVPLPSVSIEPRAKASVSASIEDPIIVEPIEPITARAEATLDPTVIINDKRAEITAEPTVIINGKRQEVSVSVPVPEASVGV